MCTLSWEFSPPGYTVFFNRDELKCRKPAESLRFSHSDSGLEFMHPVDGAKGGSWLVVNALGITTCLLNLYEGVVRPAPQGGFQSRGSLVMSLADSQGWEESLARLSEVNPCDYPPFHLFQFDPRRGVRSMKWTGTEVIWLEHPGRCKCPASGSSFENDKVVAARRDVFQQIVVAETRELRLDQLQEFHNFYEPENGAFSVKMMRQDAQTMSCSRVDVAVDQIRFLYLSREPGFEVFSDPEQLDLARISHPSA